MRATLPLAVSLLGLTACPPLEDDYEIVSSGGSKGTTGGAGGKVAGTGGKSSGGGGSAGSAGASAGTGGSVGCSECASTCCSNACVDTQTDEANCGACGVACGANRICDFGKCSSGWVGTSPPPSTFALRAKAAHTWTGDRAFVWGGLDAGGNALNDGALYDPLTDAWTLVPASATTPTPRVLANAVAVGSSVIVWGGGDEAGTIDYADGALLDLATLAWTPIAPAPAARRAAFSAFNGSLAVFYGGWDKTGLPVAGAHFYSSSAGWMGDSDAPSGRRDAASALSPNDLFISGGRATAAAGAPKYDLAFRLGLADRTWVSIEKGASARYGSFGASDGSRFLVWGGRDDNNAKDDGALFASDAWKATADNGGAPSARYHSQREAGWAFGIRDGVFLVVGGKSVVPAATLRDGGLYDVTAKDPAWSPVTAWPTGEDHDWGVGVWTGSELLIWGGRTGTALTSKGARYLP